MGSYFKKLIPIVVYILCVYILFGIYTKSSMTSKASLVGGDYTRTQMIIKYYILNIPLYVLGFIMNPKNLFLAVNNIRSHNISIRWGNMVMFALFFLYSNPMAAIYFHNIVGLELNFQMVSDNYKICCVLSTYYLSHAMKASDSFIK